MAKVRVLLADDHALVRQGIASLLRSQEDFEVVGEVADGEQAIRKSHELRPDIVLMDVSMPVVNGIDAAEQIVKTSPGTRVLMLTVHDREDYLFRALKVGASGYVLKGADVEELLMALRVVSSGEVFLYPRMTGKLVAAYLRRAEMGDEKESFDGLTQREREVLALLAEGLTNQGIATKLSLSPYTVQSHRDHIMQKLNLHSKAALIRYALSKGILEADM